MSAILEKKEENFFCKNAPRKKKTFLDLILIFDESYLQKCEEFSCGDSFGADKAGCLYEGMVCFTIIGLKNNIPYVIKAFPKNKMKV